MNTIVFIALLLVSLAPSIYAWRYERRMVRLSGARLKIAKAVTAMENLMLKGKIRLGDTSHDLIFQTMREAEHVQRYPIGWSPFYRLTAEQKTMQDKFRENIRAELDRPDCPLAEPLQDFAGAYVTAFRNQHPWMSRLHFVYILALLISAKGLLHFLKALLHIAKSYEAAKAKADEDSLTLSGSRLILR